MELDILKTDWKVVEDNTKESFRVCKNDIINFGIQLAKVQHAQAQLEHELHTIRENSISEVPTINVEAFERRTESVERQIEDLRDSAMEKRNVEEELQNLKSRYNELVATTKELITIVEKRLKAPKIVVKKVRAKNSRKMLNLAKMAKRRTYVASTATQRVHARNCPFARNVKRKNKVVFKTKMTAFKRGYRACKCLR